MGRTLRLGTRRSTLAWAQSAWVARQLQTLDPSVTIELVPIETRGDRITDVPLREIEGKDFFTAELDAALLDGRVDLSVHSLKDLSLERPAGIQLGAIPPRENPRDVIVFRSDVQERLQTGKPLRIGTSAPRRLENVPKFLMQALPTTAQPASSLSQPASPTSPSSIAPPRISLVEIRGNVDTRLGRLHEPEDSERRLEGVVLAFAGLIRLWRDTGAGPAGKPNGRDRLSTLLGDIRWMVLPLAACPSAPGQGALAVECRTADAETFALLQKLHDKQSAAQVDQERAVLATFGGGCHQKFGATSITHSECGQVLYIRGKDAQNRDLDSSDWLSAPPSPAAKIVAWDGASQDIAAAETVAATTAAEVATVEPATPDLQASQEPGEKIAASQSPVFIAHSRALPPGAEKHLEGRRVWTSGVNSWRRLAERGVWVEGCADSLGFDWILPTLQEPVLALPALDNWQVLTHTAAAATWPTGTVLATYTSPHENSVEIPKADKVTHVFWSSGSQFRSLVKQLPHTAHHACSPGKTAQTIRAAGIQTLTVFPSVEEWRRWLGLKTP